MRIAIIGPESTGKSTLASQLSEHFHAKWVPEYARQYVENLNRPYTYQDICQIAQKQIEQQAACSELSGTNCVFFDTDLIITKVWLLYCYQKVPEFVTEALEQKFFDLYLLCAPDLPWEPDPVREHGDDREFFFEWYKKEIERTETPYAVIDGMGVSRLDKAIRAVETMAMF